jgi:RNA methyltransferase, TrmH family
MIISSRNNATIKLIRRLRNRRARHEAGLSYVEGIRIVAEAVQVGADIERIVVARGLLTSEFAAELLEQARGAGIECMEVTDAVFRSISAKDGPQGLGALVRQRWTSLDEIDPGDAPWWVALSNVQSPGNLGTILRTTDAVGCNGVILVGHTADPHDPGAVRASMGALFTQRVARATLDELIAWTQAHGYALVGTSDSATLNYRQADYPQRLVVFMGSEQHGLSPEEEAACDAIVRIPMMGRSDSLTISVATGVVLYEILARRG